MVKKFGSNPQDSTGLLISLGCYGILLLFHSLVSCHFLFKIRGRDLSHKIKYGTLAVLLVAWFGLFFEFVFILLNLSFSWVTMEGYCSFISWVRYNWFILFELTLYIFWLIRINHTFKYSIYEVRKSFIIITLTILILTCLIFVIITAISIIPQYMEIDLSLSSSPFGYDCIPDWKFGIFALYISGQIATIIFNLFFASTFFYKLSKLQEIQKHGDGQSHNARHLRVFQLMQKHTLLALLSLFTSIICWIIFDLISLNTNGINQDFLVILSIDRIVKSLCIILMYKFYEYQFSKICYICLIATHACSKNLFPYFNPKPKTDPSNPESVLLASTIFAVAHNIQVEQDLYCEDESINESDIDNDRITWIGPKSDPPDKPLPNIPNKYKTTSDTSEMDMKQSIGLNKPRMVPRPSKSKSKSRPSKALPTIDFSVSPYYLCNFIACLTEPAGRKYRYLNYSSTTHEYAIMPSQIFNQIENIHNSTQTDVANINFVNQNQGYLIMKDFQFDRNKFSFIKKNNTPYPYRLAIRLKNHHKRLDDAQKILKYAEYKLNEIFKKINANQTFDYEIYFDNIANDIQTQKLVKNGNVLANFGSSLLEMQQPADIQVSWSRQESNPNHDGLYEHSKQRNSHLNMDNLFNRRNQSTSSINNNNKAPKHRRQLTPSQKSINSHSNRPLPIIQPVTPYQSVDWSPQTSDVNQ